MSIATKPTTGSSRFLLLAALMLGCDGSPVEIPIASEPGIVASSRAAPSDSTPSSPSPSRISLWSYSVLPIDFVGSSREYRVQAFDSRGERVSVEGASVRSEDSAVAVVRRADILSITDPNGHHPSGLLSVTVLETGVGTTRITATLGHLSASHSLRVDPVPSARVELVVDSFAVAEYTPCTQACPYVAYAPLLWLRQPAGTSGETLEGVEVSLGPLSTGWCPSSGSTLAPGQEIRVNERIDPYPYANDFILFNLAGPVAERTATARMLVRNAAGKFGIVEVYAPVSSRSVPFGSAPEQPCG